VEKSAQMGNILIKPQNCAHLAQAKLQAATNAMLRELLFSVTLALAM